MLCGSRVGPEEVRGCAFCFGHVQGAEMGFGRCCGEAGDGAVEGTEGSHGDGLNWKVRNEGRYMEIVYVNLGYHN